MATVEVVDSIRACHRAVQILQNEEVVAADAEGVHMSRTGPMTLLQIGTVKGHVYLFDVKQEPRIFRDEGLKGFLESESVVKVMHSGKNDAEALFWQFGVQLKGVFDTQVAQQVLDKANGRRLPSLLKLADVVSKYCPSKVASVEEGKDSVQTKWMKLEGEYWAKRPLTDEMKKYAANDVVVLIPEVYTEQKRLLEANCLMDTLRRSVDETIRSKLDRELSENITLEQKDIAKSVLLDFASTARSQKLDDITDEDVLAALNVIRTDDVTAMGLPALIKDLKLQTMRAKLKDMESEFQEKVTILRNGYDKVLKFFESANTPQDLKEMGSEFLSTLQKAGLIPGHAEASRGRRQGARRY
nr:hypothetical protein BaRGS_021511 [Batillaria attramentaria]